MARLNRADPCVPRAHRIVITRITVKASMSMLLHCRARTHTRGSSERAPASETCMGWADPRVQAPDAHRGQVRGIDAVVRNIVQVGRHSGVEAIAQRDNVPRPTATDRGRRQQVLCSCRLSAPNAVHKWVSACMCRALEHEQAPCGPRGSGSSRRPTRQTRPEYNRRTGTPSLRSRRALTARRSFGRAVERPLVLHACGGRWRGAQRAPATGILDANSE